MLPCVLIIHKHSCGREGGGEERGRKERGREKRGEERMGGKGKGGKGEGRGRITSCIQLREGERCEEYDMVEGGERQRTGTKDSQCVHEDALLTIHWVKQLLNQELKQFLLESTLVNPLLPPELYHQLFAKVNWVHLRDRL